MGLTPSDFGVFFEEVHGYEPFPWQRKLAEHVAEHGRWPAVLDLPTGSGKTAAIDVAVFHLALEADRGPGRRAPVRIAFIVDRRLVVDDAFARARVLQSALAAPEGSMCREVAERLLALCDDDRVSIGGYPLLARRLRGGIPREDDWARTPSQPTILCSTVDQVGSRLLFRGYGVSDSMKPVHAGLIGSDCLILLDEAHLAEPFRQTLDAVARYRGQQWRETPDVSPWGMALLTATPGEDVSIDFALTDDDRCHPVLKRRLEASKPARLVDAGRGTSSSDTEGEDEGGDDAPSRRAPMIVFEVRRALEHFSVSARGAIAPAIGVVVNRVSRARTVHSALCDAFRVEIDAGIIDKPVLMIGPARPVDRDHLANELGPIRTKPWNERESRSLGKTFIVVATQCIEAGVDIDFDALVTEVAALDALRQRFGRLNRAGRDIVPYAAIIASKADLSSRKVDPVYDRALKPTWEQLVAASTKHGNDNVVDFGIGAFNVPMSTEVISRKEDAPVLMPAHLDLLSQTSPIPNADPEVALYLHGPKRQSDSISVVWRADIDPDELSVDREQRIRRLLTLVPPRSQEAIELPLWAVRRWLRQANVTDALADAPIDAPEEDTPQTRSHGRRAFVWKGADERSRWTVPNEIRPGDAIVVPARYGGVDEFGWHPRLAGPARDVARVAAKPFAGRRFTVRVVGDLAGDDIEDALADALAGAESSAWEDVREALLDLPLRPDIREDLDTLLRANRRNSVVAHLDLYGTTDDGRPRGVVFVAPFGIKEEALDEEGSPNATEDDASGSLFGLALKLEEHSGDVEQKAERFAKAAGLSEDRIRDLKIAGYLHDAGKADARFQKWLHHGDPLGPDPDEPADVLAKSGRPLPPSARAASGLPENWRHEAFSVRLASLATRFPEAKDPELVLWLVGVHHGYGRPFFPHSDPLDVEERTLPIVSGLPRIVPAGPGPQSLGFDWKGADWPKLFEKLKARYGAWGLVHMEAILRLADHRASEDVREKRRSE